MADDFLEMNPNGTIEFTDSSGGTRRLRRPTLGEYRKLREAYDDALVTAQRAGAALSKKQSEAISQEAALSTEEVEALRAESRQVNYAAEDGRIEWFKQMVETLDGGLLDDTTCPTWASNLDMPIQVFSHWRSMPGPRSGDA